MTEKQISKRELLKKAAYVAPAILTLKAVPSFATNGSGLNEQAREEQAKEKKEKSNNRLGPNNSEKKQKKQKNNND